VTLAFVWCSRCIWEIDQAQLDKPPWSEVASAIAALAAAGAWTGTYMARHGGREGFHRQLPLVQLAAYPEYDGKRDQHRERHSDAGAHVPEHNEFPDCHGKARSLATVIGAQGGAPAPPCSDDEGYEPQRWGIFRSDRRSAASPPQEAHATVQACSRTP
jgi:hypothetical protein